MQKLKKFICAMLCFSMMFSCVQTVQAAEAKEYDIYPIVRDIDYDNTEFTMSNHVNVIYEEGIDNATKTYLEEVLNEKDVTFTSADKVKEGEWNILLGIDDSGESADAYEDTLTLKTSDLYDQYDGYLLEAKDGQITIVGGDSDAVFSGVATLKMMLSSFGNRQLVGAQIEDYAGMEYRGFIEGFYGSWSHENRKSLMEFAKDIKMNTYVYAAKGDEYHKNIIPYPAEELAKLEELVVLGKETKCEFVWSIHLGSFFRGIANNNYDETYYEAQYELLIAKLTQLLEIGVTKFDVLNDDFGAGDNAFVVSVLNRLNEEFIEKNGCDPITYCPQGYNKAWSGNGAELEALKNLDESITIYWTGDDVNAPITQETVNFLKEKTNHDPVFWLNYPVNEHAGSGIFLGDITHYARDGVTGLAGAGSNPSRFAQTTKVALFQLSALFWNNSNYSEYAEEIWLNSFNYLEPEVTESYRTIARNTANCPNSGRVSQGFPESEYIRENLEAILAKVTAGESLKGEDADILVAEFENIINAIEVFRSECLNTALVEELNPWLNSLMDVTTASSSILKAAIALEEEDISAAWSEFATASKALQGWNTYPTYSGSGNMALAGSKRLQPFASKMVSYVKDTITPLLDSNYSARNLYAKIGGEVRTLDDNTAKMLDGDLTTYVSWQVDQKKDDYFGVDLGKVTKVTDISILQANSDTDHDYFHKAVLEYSVDGVTFTQLGEQYNDTISIELDELDIEARYVRFRLVETGTANKQNYWTFVREFTVNEQSPEENRIYTNVEEYARQPLTIIGKEWGVTDLTDVTLESGEYIGIKFVNLSSISSFINEATGVENLTLEISDNGAVWTQVTDLSQPQILKYVRLINKTNAAITFDVEKMSVVVENTKANPVYLESNLNNGLQEGSWNNVFDGEPSTYAWTNEAQQAGDYIIFDLGSAISLYDVRIVLPDGRPRLYNAEIQISKDKLQWDTIATVENDNSTFELPPYRTVDANANGETARYLRIYITAYADGAYLKLQEIIINSAVDAPEGTDVITASFGKNPLNAIDGSLSTLFSGTATVEDYIEYKFTESANYNSISILQDPNNVGDGQNTERIFGKDRYATGYKAADAYKTTLGVDKFNAVVVATGKNFADALSGSYLAIVKEAPILLTNGKDDNVAELHAYIKANVNANGTVYILGGTAAVPAAVEAIESEGYTVNRLAGGTRYETNLKILAEAGITGTELIVATGKEFADSLSASATGRPILLVKPGAALNAEQKAIAETVKGGNIYVVGGTGAVTDGTKAELESYATVERIAGAGRQETSKKIAEKFFPDADTVVVASARKFPDGLCGGPLAAAMDAPLLLTATGNTAIAANYVQTNAIKSGIILGGEGAISEESVTEIFGNMKVSSPIVVKVLTDDGYDTIGYLDESAKTFELDAEENVYALRIEFEEETDISIYEIYLDAVNSSDDIGEYVEPIIKGAEEEPDTRPEAANLTPGKTITVSGTSDGNKDQVNDGDTSTKWDSDFIKGNNANENSWITVDLGNDKTSIFDEVKISYFNKIYPTIMEIQVSNDGQNWTTVSALTREHNGATHPVVTETYETAYAARYVRLFFEELNSAAAGNGVGVTEWEIKGVALSNLSVKEVQALEDVNAALNTSAEELALPEFVNVTLTHATLGDYEVQVPVNWNTDGYDSTVADTYTLEGTLDLPATVDNTENISAAVNVVAAGN